MKTRDSFSINLRREIKNKGLTYEKAAELFGISLSFLNQVMRGQSDPSLETILNMAKRLKISPGQLLASEDDEAKEHHVDGRSELIARVVLTLGAFNDTQLRDLAAFAEGLLAATSSARAEVG